MARTGVPQSLANSENIGQLFGSDVRMAAVGMWGNIPDVRNPVARHANSAGEQYIVLGWMTDCQAF